GHACAEGAGVDAGNLPGVGHVRAYQSVVDEEAAPEVEGWPALDVDRRGRRNTLHKEGSNRPVDLQVQPSHAIVGQTASMIRGEGLVREDIVVGKHAFTKERFVLDIERIVSALALNRELTNGSGPRK